MEITEKAWMMLENYPLCDHCLGRQFAMLGHEMDNQRRGEALKTILTLEGHQLALRKDKGGISLLKALATNGSFIMAKNILKKMKKRVKESQMCFLCEGRFKILSQLVKKATEMLREYEYKTFLVGVKLPIDVEEREDEFKAKFEVQHSESMRNEFSREIGKMLVEMTGKTVNFMKPEVVVLVNPFKEQIELQINPLYIMGRYKKLTRGIPQSKWICMKCMGRGCPRCNWTGKMYPESVEELIAGPVLKKTLGEDVSFHAAGREDIDARMLGRGRPFIIEVKKPKKRDIDLEDLRNRINSSSQGKVKVSKLRFVDKEMVRELKRLEGTEKVYKVIIKFDGEISDEELEAIKETFTDTKIQQQTPLRVLHRRADLTREKYIYETKVKRLAHDKLEMRIRCQGGLYIKELITGDEGRTVPNVSEVVNAKAVSIELDVLNVITRSRRILK